MSFVFFLIIISKKKTHAQTLEKKKKEKGEALFNKLSLGKKKHLNCFFKCFKRNCGCNRQNRLRGKRKKKLQSDGFQFHTSE